MNRLTSILGSFGRRSSSRTKTSGPSPSQELDKVSRSEFEIHLSLDLLDFKTSNKVISKVCKIPGVSSVTHDGDRQITVTGTVDPEALQNKLRNYRPMIQKVVLRKKNDSGEEGVKLRTKQDSDEESGSEKSNKGKNLVLDEEFPRGETYSDWMPSPVCNWEDSDDFDSGDDITIVADKFTSVAPNRRHLNNDWYSLCNFLSNRMPPLTPSGCSPDDVIDFLRTRQFSGSIEALVGRLITASEAHGLIPENNPFRSLAVTSYLKAASGVTHETECILIFSCNDNLDVDETYFIESISKELLKREVIPLTYNLLGRENLDMEMIYRSSVGIMILSDSYACSRQSLDHLVAIMEHWKATDLIIIPIYFKVTLSDICGLKGRFEASFQLLEKSLKEDRIQKWRAAVTKIVSIGGLEWTKGTQFMLAEEVVRNASLRLYLKNSKSLVGILALLNHSQSSDVEMVEILSTTYVVLK
ncbi:hypothetical protein CARUB_v10007493mg, partial [Capsella rubella]